MEMIVYLCSPQGAFIKGDGRWVGNGGCDGIEFTQHSDNPMLCGILDGYIPGQLHKGRREPQATMMRDTLAGKAAHIPPQNIALVIVTGEPQR